MGAPESHYDWLRLLEKRLDRGLVGLGGPPYGSVVTTDRRFHLDFDGHSWPDLMEPGWEPTESGGVIFLGWEHMCGVLRKDSEYQYRATFDKAVQIAGAVTNLITNPSFETGVAGWATAWGDTIGRTTDDYVYGDYCGTLAPAGGAGCAMYDTAAVAGATDYTWSAWVKADASVTGDIFLRIWTPAFATLATSANHPKDGKWRYLTCTANSAANANLNFALVGWTMAGADIAYIDGAMAHAGSYPVPYADGSLGAGHSWVGAAHASTSTRAAATLTYPNDVVAYPSGDCLEQLTIAGWFIPAWGATARGGNANIWDCRGGAADRISLYFNAANNDWRVHINGGDAVDSTAETFNPWEPQFLAATLDFDADQYRLYINDNAVAEGVGPYAPPAFGANAFHVGDNWNTLNQVDGLIDDFVIYPRVLSADEIHAIYKFGNPLLPPTHANHRQIFGEWPSTLLAGGGRSTTAWTTLDLVDDCGIPFGAKAVQLFVEARDTTLANKFIYFRKDAASGHVFSAISQVANVTNTTCGIVPVANGRTIDYSITAGGVGTFLVLMKVVGVWI